MLFLNWLGKVAPFIDEFMLFNCLLVSSKVNKNIPTAFGYNEIIIISDGLIKCVSDLRRKSVISILGHLIYLYVKQKY